jgi:hypothetical protein
MLDKEVPAFVRFMSKNNELTRSDVIAAFKPPFSFTRGYVHDSTGSIIMDDAALDLRIVGLVRGYGASEDSKNVAEFRQFLGTMIASALTLYWTNFSLTSKKS